MNPTKLIHIIITLLLTAGVYGAGSLVWNEIQTGNGCPKIWIIPVCAIILICFLIPLIVHAINKYLTPYFIFTGLALAIAIMASIMQYTGIGACPKLENELPMCYVSFLVFSTLIILKKLYITQKK